jgi:hypothetical protein
MNGPLTRASLHLERAKSLVVELFEITTMDTRPPPRQFETVATALRVVRQELEWAERNLRDAGTWTGEAGAGDRLRGIAVSGTDRPRLAGC